MTVIRSERILTESGLRPGCVHIHDGRIAAITHAEDAGENERLVDAGSHVVMSGLVDTHVHVNEPGRTDWEGFASATRAAAAGGVTSFFDMPLNSVPATTTVASLHAKRDAARARISVNVGFIGGIVPGNASDIAPMHAEGIRLFKCFLVPSGVEEFPGVGEHDLRLALAILAELGATLLVHAELPELIAPSPQGDPTHYTTYLASRPDSAETEAVRLMIRLAAEFRMHVHIVHLSSSESLRLLHEAQAAGISITCETCPHYLTFSAEEVPTGATAYKCAPPIRDAATRDALWHGLSTGEISMIVSDHSPCPPELKHLEDGDFFQAWGGISSLQLGLPATWHQARARGASIGQLSEWMSAAPARLAGIADRKGTLAEGYDADIVIWDPEAPVAVDAMTLYHRHPVTPYRGMTLTGRVHSTFVGGAEVFRDDRIINEGQGILLSEPHD